MSLIQYKSNLILNIKKLRKIPTGKRENRSPFGVSLKKLTAEMQLRETGLSTFTQALREVVSEGDVLVVSDRITSQRVPHYTRRKLTVPLDFDLLPVGFDFSDQEIIIDTEGNYHTRAQLGLNYLSHHSSIVHTCYTRIRAYLPADGLPVKVAASLSV